MNLNLFRLKRPILLFSLFLCLGVFGQGNTTSSSGAGNGGDQIRASFIETGHVIVNAYQDVMLDNNVDPDLLRDTLDINKIKTSSKQLFDNKGNPVDALGQKDEIILFIGSVTKGDGWLGIFQRGVEDKKLILHEMFRSAYGVGADDNYDLSIKILNTKIESSKLCEDILDCVKFAGRLTGTKYIIDKDVKGGIIISDNVILTKNNIDYYLSLFLNQANFTRIPLLEENAWKVIPAREIRYDSPPMYELGKDKLPHTYDYIMVTYELENPSKTEELAVTMRPFMAKYSRVVELNHGFIAISAPAIMVKNMLKLIKIIDRK
ncbi:hypothetical protein N9N67_05050 [Bacteriovoracaceae bacterium]|nr:hypothetical protein [Bacteriovoracaceae bacterium]